VLSYVADGTPTDQFIRVDPLLGIFGILAICIMSSRHARVVLAMSEAASTKVPKSA
jgi:hypothetical protein